MYGLGASTNLSDRFPWGIWIGFDILCGVGLAAGGFTIVAIVHIFNLEQFKPILRPTILTAFLGYVLVVVALMFDLGRPDRIWHPDGDVESAFGHVRSGVVRDAVQHRARARVRTGHLRAIPPGDGQDR